MHALLGCKRVAHSIPSITPPKLTARIASSLEQMMIPKSGIVANEYVHAPKHFPGFDGRVTVMAQVGRNSPVTAQYFYMEVRIAPKKLVSESDARVSKVVKALVSHFICTLYLSPADQLSSFKNLHVVFYEWGAESDTNEVELEAVKCAVNNLFAEKSGKNSINSTTDDDLVSARQKLVEDVEKIFQDEALKKGAMVGAIQNRSLSDDCMHEYMRQCFQAYIDAGMNVYDETGKTNLARAYVVNRKALSQWLVPPVSPVPYLVAEIEKVSVAPDTPTAVDMVGEV
jgi:hypothetical protein